MRTRQQGDAAPMATILDTYTDEAPMLATHSFLPIISAYASTAGVDVETRDISLAARLLAQFTDLTPAEQQVAYTLAQPDALAKTPEAKILKRPSVTASIPHPKPAIQALKAPGSRIPPDHPQVPPPK